MKPPNQPQPPISTMGESKFLLQATTRRLASSQTPQDMTPGSFSAVRFRNCCFPCSTIPDQSVSNIQSQVSSFNLPSFCDATLITPVTTRSPIFVGTSKPEKEIKLSPSTTSPVFNFLPTDDDYGHGYDESRPMKHKANSSSWDSFPDSSVYPTPYHRTFGVSATSVSAPPGAYTTR